MDRLGSYLLYPFFGFYIRARFDVDYAGVGLLFTMLALGGIIGGIAGGAIADKLGRRVALLSGLIGSAITTLCMGFVNTLPLFYIFAFLNGVLGDLGHPGRQAMVTDLLTPKQRSEGFSIMRIAANLAATIGPALGGWISATTNNYLILFIADVVSSFITGVIVFLVIPESKPKDKPSEGVENQKKKFGSTILGYFQVLKDWQFMLFILIGVLSTWVYMMFNTTLPVFLLDEHGFSEAAFGLLLSFNALTVVLCQFWISRLLSKYPPMLFMAAGVLLYGLGFALFGFVSSQFLFFMAILIITIGEMISAPFIMAAAGRFAPDDMRGRYMAISGWRRIIPRLFGIILAGFIMDSSSNPSILWFIIGIVALGAMMGYIGLHKITKKRFSPVVIQE